MPHLERYFWGINFFFVYAHHELKIMCRCVCVMCFCENIYIKLNCTFISVPLKVLTIWVSHFGSFKMLKINRLSHWIQISLAHFAIKQTEIIVAWNRTINYFINYKLSFIFVTKLTSFPIISYRRCTVSFMSVTIIWMQKRWEYWKSFLLP